MRLQTSQKAELFGRTSKIAFMGVFAVFVWAFVLSLSFSPRTDAATSSTINFQARLESSAGNIAANGTYNVEFKLYNASSSSGSTQGSCTGDTACLWTEDYLVSASNGVQVVNGYLTTNLGSITAFPSNMNWNQQLWLTMRIGSTGSSPTWDTEMNPRLLLTATPYSFQAGELSTTNGSNVATLTFTAPTAADSITLPDASGMVCLDNTSSCGFATGSGAAFIQGGNSFGTTAIIGTSDNNGINIQTDSHAVLTLSNTGLFAYSPVTSHDSTTAFKIQQANFGSTVFDVDTTNRRVGINDTSPSASLHVQVASDASTIAEIIQGTNSQSGDLLELQNSGNVIQDKFSSAGQLTLGTVATSGTVYQGVANFADGTTDGYVATLETTTLTASQTITMPNATGTICLTSQNCSTAGSGYILNQGGTPGTVQGGNFNINGTGIAGILQAGTFDTPISESLSLGSTNANAITIGNSTNNIATTINGTVIIKPTPSHDSITTFQVQNASGATILSADTTANTLNLSGNLNLNQLAAPTPAPTVAVGSAGSLTGTYCYAISFVTASGQTDYGPDSSSVSPSSQEVNLTAIPTGPSNLVTARDIYRDDCYGDYSSLVGTISNNTATTFTDNNTSPVAVGSDINRTAQFQINGNTILIADTNSANTGLGVGALQGNTTGAGNNAIGTEALYSNTAGYFNNALGYMTLYGNTTGYGNNAIGESALYSNTAGYFNNALGYMTLYGNTTGAGNNAIGTEALYSNTAGYFNNALGYGALANNTTGSDNNAIGTEALLYNTTGTDNNAIGNQALYNNDSWNNNALGDNALYSDTSGGSNTAIGSQALQSTTTGAGNTAIGFKALSYSNTTGSYNSALGYYAGFQDSGGNFGTGAVLQNATAIGAYAQVQASNSIVLGSVDTATKVGIGTTIPLNTFSVSPMIYNTGTACSVASSGSSTCSGTSTVYLYGSSTVWTASMVGDELIFADGQESIISAVTSNTAITLAVAVNEASGSYYRIHVIGLQVTNAGNTYVQNTSTTAFQIQNAAGTSLLAADTTNMQVIIGNTTNGVAISTSGGITAYGTARHTNKIILTPEYAGAVLDNGGASSDIGTMTAGYDSTQKENYYQWTTAQSTNQTYDIVIQIPIPSNFSSALPFATNDPLTVDINTSDTTNGTVVGTLLDTSGTAVTNWNTCSLTPTVTGWITSGAGATYGATCNITTGTWTAGGVATLRLHIQAPPSGTTKVGDIVLTYISAY